MLGPTAVANPIVTLLRWHMSTLAILLGVGFRSPQASVNLTDRIMCVTARPDYANPAKITVKAVRPQVVASWQVKTAIVLSIRRWSGSSRPIDFGRTVNPPPRGWRKLHLGVDADTHEVVAVELTRDDVGDVSELAGLLDQVATRVASVMADGAYDGETVYNAVTDRHPDADIVVPPRATAVPSTDWGDAARSAYCNRRKAWSHRLAASFWLQPAKPRRDRDVSVRNHHWTASIRSESVRSTDRSKEIGCNALNRMTSFGMPATIRIG